MHTSQRRQRRQRHQRHQRGVAIITALLLTTLAVTIVASLFWQQQVQVRSMENQRLQLQTRWILRGALDWSRLILSQDGRDNPLRTTLNGVWATPLAETRLDQYIERERAEHEKFDATLSGQITDAQGRYNLTNLALLRKPNALQQTVFQRLLSNLQLDPSLAQRVAQQVANGQKTAALTEAGAASGSGSNPATGTASGSGGSASSGSSSPAATTSGGSSGSGEPIEVMRVEDLLAISGFTPQAIERLREFVIVLPASTPLNVNTAPAELLSAAVTGLSTSEASTLVNNRKRGGFQDIATFTAALNGRSAVDPNGLATKSSYFLVLSRVKLDRA
ncbi:MAG: type II secretion system minor pseudopilin GspK, partial [Sphingomonadaceae bacterium]